MKLSGKLAPCTLQHDIIRFAGAFFTLPRLRAAFSDSDGTTAFPGLRVNAGRCPTVPEGVPAGGWPGCDPARARWFRTFAMNVSQIDGRRWRAGRNEDRGGRNRGRRYWPGRQPRRPTAREPSSFQDGRSWGIRKYRDRGRASQSPRCRPGDISPCIADMATTGGLPSPVFPPFVVSADPTAHRFQTQPP